MIAVGILDSVIIYLYKDNNKIQNYGQQFMNVLLQSLNDNYLLVAAETINALIDLFNDDDNNSNINKLWNENKILNKLKTFLPIYAKKIKNIFNTSSKKELDEVSMERIEVMYENLSGFIDYKKKH